VPSVIQTADEDPASADQSGRLPCVVQQDRTTMWKELTPSRRRRQSCRPDFVRQQVGGQWIEEVTDMRKKIQCT
jgi:hypothetical protein